MVINDKKMKCSLKNMYFKDQNSPKILLHWQKKSKMFYTRVRLRTNCSALIIDLITRNIADLPLCRCGSIEDAQYLLLFSSTKCPHQCYFRSHSIILKVFYVWGHVTFTQMQFIYVKHIQTFIINTKRFNV